MESVLSTAVLVITIISVSSGFNNKCVRESDGATFKHPESEQLFFICFNGETVEVKCRDNYYFNEQNGKCVLTIGEPGENPTTVNLCENIAGAVLIPSETSCQHFHFCMNGVHQLESVCAPNQLFDPIVLTCRNAQDVNCNPPITTISTTLAQTTFTTEIFTTTTENETTTSEGTTTRETTTEDTTIFETTELTTENETTTTEGTTTEGATTEGITIENTTTEDTTTEGTTTKETTTKDTTANEITTNEQTSEISVTTTTIFETTELTTENETTTTEGTTTEGATTEGITIENTTTEDTTTEGTTTKETTTKDTTTSEITTNEQTSEISMTTTTIFETTELTEEITTEMSTVTTEQTTIGTTSDYPTTPPTITTTNPESICYDKPDTHLVNNPASCDAFFVCFFEIPIPGICPAPLYFNPDRSECDYPENVICHEGTEPTTETPTFCDGIPNGKLFDNPESCSHFFICINNVPQPGVCPLGLYFNDVSRSCEPPENVNCFPATIPTEIPTVPTTEAPPNTEQPPSDACIGFKDGTLVNNPRYCDAFYFCFHENAIKGTCPPPSLFNSRLGICDLPENVNCEIETTSTMIETTTKPVDICYGLSDFTFLNDPRECADHFICFNDQSLPQSCPDGFYFDPSISICARSETVNCDDNQSTTHDTTIATQETSTTQPISTTTESSTNVETSTTELSTTTSKEPTITTEESTTPPITPTTEETSTAQPIPENCPITGIHAFPNPERCSRFRFCASGVDFELACPAGQHFVFATEKCLPREAANCTIPIPVCDPIASAQTLLILHHPHYCNRYFYCFNGLMTPFECPEGEHFDIVSQVCGSPAIANCEA